MNPIFKDLEHKLIVSCQAEGNSPFNSPNGVTMFAIAAIQGGAAGIRSEGIAKTAEIIKNVNVPVIGLLKSKFEDGTVRITGSFNEVEQLINIGTHIIAIDGTTRLREGLPGNKFIEEIKKRYNVTVMADISTYEEGILCAKCGADCISTTLSGYTPYTSHLKNDEPDYNLIQKLSSTVDVPVFAEGRINTPAIAKKVMEKGAFAIVVGSAITRPALITEWFVKAIEKQG